MHIREGRQEEKLTQDIKKQTFKVKQEMTEKDKQKEFQGNTNGLRLRDRVRQMDAQLETVRSLLR